MYHQERLPEAIDLSHHLSEVAKARTFSPLKEFTKYLSREGIINLAGGFPHPDFFPFDEISANVYSQDAFPVHSTSEKSTLVQWLSQLFAGKKRSKWDKLKVPRYPTNPGDINLAASLQYSRASGLPQLQKVVHEFVDRVYRPAYSNWATFLHVGNTNGWLTAALTLCNPGDAILTGEWTYPSAIAATYPEGLKAIPVPLDGEGMRSDALLEILMTWDEHERGAARPRVMYTIPVGQNPTGGTMSVQRKMEIYEICVKFDVIIVEDDPYYFLQEGRYVSRAKRPKPAEVSNEAFIDSLEPSYLRFDYQGRVVRLDSFSKTMAPGCRLGWFTCHPLFAERFERQNETNTQSPCGISQALVTSLLLNWKTDGYLRWLQGLRAQYRKRRDFFVDCFDNTFHLVSRSAGANYIIYDGYIKSKTAHLQNNWREKFVNKDTQYPVLSFMPPTSGMFVWLQINFKDHPSFTRLGHKKLETKLWEEFADANVLAAPGYIFNPNITEDNYNDAGPGHMRLSFSNLDLADLRKAVRTMAVVLERFFYESDQL